MNASDVRLLLALVAYIDLVVRRDGALYADSWSKQFADAERAAMQRLVDEVGL